MKNKNAAINTLTHVAFVGLAGLSLGVGCAGSSEEGSGSADIAEAQPPQPKRLVFARHTGCAVNAQGVVKCFTLNDADSAVVAAPAALAGLGPDVQEIGGVPDDGGALCARFANGAVKCSVAPEFPERWGSSNTLVDLSAELPGTTTMTVMVGGPREVTVCGVNASHMVRCTHIGRVDRPHRNNEPVVYDLKFGSIMLPELGEVLSFDDAGISNRVAVLLRGGRAIAGAAVNSAIENGEIKLSVGELPRFDLPSPAARWGLLASGELFLYAESGLNVWRFAAGSTPVKVSRLIGWDRNSTGGFNPTARPAGVLVLDEKSHLTLLTARLSKDLAPWTPADSAAGISTALGARIAPLSAIEAKDVSFPAVLSTSGDVFVSSFESKLVKVEGL